MSIPETSIPLREHLEMLQAERDKALVHQHTEYERRLEDLNHAHQRAQQTAHTYLTIDKYEDNREAEATALKLALERQDGRLAVLENFRSKATGAGLVLGLFAGAVGAAIGKVFGL